jgi:peptide/nickel transport system permease protein
MVRGDWGTSFSHQRPALDVIRAALPYTLFLGLVCLLFQYAVGIALGILAARRAGGALDHWIRSASLVLYSVPVFWLGLMAILVFHLYWGILPAGGASSVDSTVLSPLAKVMDKARHLILPVGVLTLANAARVTRFVRNSLLDALNSDYVRTARAKGLSGHRVIWTHALRNSLVPVAQLFGLSIPALLNGILVIEVVFAWPGLGRVMFVACLARDYPVVLAITAFSATLVIVGNLVADGLHYALDPRLRRG